MSNVVFEEKSMYNKEFKEKFYKRYPEQTWNAYKRVFYYSEPVEDMYKSDLYEFNLDQISEVLRTMEPTSHASVRAVISVIKSYIDWAISHRTNNINPLDITDAEWEKKFIDTSKKLYWSKEEIDEIISKCRNAQDSVIVALLFEGVNGKEVSELRNLKYENIDFENAIANLINENGEVRKLQLSQETLDLVKRAALQKEYFKRNGNISPNSRNVKATSDLLENGFLIKPANTKNVHMDQVNTHVIYGRLSTIAEIMDIPNFVVKNIQRSGMIYQAKLIKERDGHFGDTEQYYEICERFGFAKYNNHGYDHYKWYGLKDYVNEENIEKFYGDSSV